MSERLFQSNMFGCKQISVRFLFFSNFENGERNTLKTLYNRTTNNERKKSWLKYGNKRNPLDVQLI